jgi:hypothetical protein
MADVYFYRLRKAALREVTAKLELIPLNTPSHAYWATVLKCLERKAKK